MHPITVQTTDPTVQITLDEAAEFWESHDSAEYWDEMQDAAFEVELRQNLLHPGLLVLAKQPDMCPRCQQPLAQKVIKYVSWHAGRLLVIRDVSVLQCRNRHEYILEGTLDLIEQLFALEARHTLQPAEMLQVPVFTIEMVG
jgi:hypothetical protein